MPRKTIKKYTPEEILAALEAAGQSEETSEIADRCRVAAGDNRWPDHGMADVEPGLKALVADGRLLTTKVANPYGRTAAERQEDENAYIARRSHSIGRRVYATPKWAAEWRLHLENIEVQNAATEVGADSLRRLLAELSPGEPARLETHTSREYNPHVEITLDLPGLQALVEALTRLENAS